MKSVKSILLTGLFLASSSVLLAQEEVTKVPFNGLVTDVHGQPIKRVKVYNLNEKRYALTNKQGRFGLTNVQASDTLHFIYKKRRYDIPVNGMRSMKVRLADQSEMVEEDQSLVDLGMAFVKRREFTGASSGLNGEELIRMGYTDITQAILGCVPGARQHNGHILIRGINSVTLNLEPLYLVDGCEVSSISGITLFEVDHIEVIKDANMYGARGANGVIAITTKRGK